MQGDCLTCNSGSPTKRLLQVTDMDSGRRIHVSAVVCVSLLCPKNTSRCLGFFTCRHFVRIEINKCVCVCVNFCLQEGLT